MYFSMIQSTTFIRLNAYDDHSYDGKQVQVTAKHISFSEPLSARLPVHPVLPAASALLDASLGGLVAQRAVPASGGAAPWQQGCQPFLQWHPQCRSRQF